MKPLARILPEAVPQKEALQNARAQIALRSWTLAAGETLAQHAQPLKYSKGTLTLASPSPAWAQEARLLAPRILEKLNDLAQGERLFTNLRVEIKPLPAEEEAGGAVISSPHSSNTERSP
jgi:predicted nucleic acid-binding Zn ribbon protein